MLLRRLRAAISGETWPEMWAACSGRLEAAAVKAREGMYLDPGQTPATLMRPAMDAGQPAAPRGEIIGYEVAGKLYHPADVTIIRTGP
jgi:hypothetical protein